MIESGHMVCRHRQVFSFSKLQGGAKMRNLEEKAGVVVIAAGVVVLAFCVWYQTQNNPSDWAGLRWLLEEIQ
jgi:hypothetical protein